MDRAQPTPRSTRIRRLLRVVHRDTGYLVAALTIVYAVSGVAVNHVADWNPSRVVEREERVLAPGTPPDDAGTAVPAIVEALGLDGPPRETFRPAPGRLLLFWDGMTVEADFAAGRATIERVRDRPVLREFNFLHLNEPKGWWTLVADAYAVALGLLALTGLFILRGRDGLAGRGKWFGLAGLAIPLLAIALLRTLP